MIKHTLLIIILFTFSSVLLTSCQLKKNIEQSEQIYLVQSNLEDDSFQDDKSGTGEKDNDNNMPEDEKDQHDSTDEKINSSKRGVHWLKVRN